MQRERERDESNSIYWVLKPFLKKYMLCKLAFSLSSSFIFQVFDGFQDSNLF